MWAGDNTLKNGYTDGILDDLTTIIPLRADYAGTWQNTMREALSRSPLVNGNGGEASIWDILDTFCELVKGQTISIPKRIAAEKILGKTAAILAYESMVHDSDMGGSAANLISAHYPELALAWMESLEGETAGKLAGICKYSKVLINCPVEVEVRDGEGTLVARIDPDGAEDIQQGLACYLDDDGQKVVIIPEDGDYEIKCLGSDDGTMSCSAYEYESGSDTPVAFECWKELPLQKGSAYEAVSVSGNLSLSGKEGIVVPDISGAGDVDFPGKYFVEAEIEGNGELISAGGVYSYGEYCSLEAKDEGGFMGWRIDGDIVSTDTLFRFMVQEDTHAVAVFKTVFAILFELGPNPKLGPNLFCVSIIYAL